jgi:hypothetical protein
VTAPPLIDTSGILTGWGDEDAAHMVIFGGRTLHNSTSDEAGERRQEEISLNDAHILDLKTLRWIPSSLSNAYSVARGASVTEEGAASGLQSIDRVPPAMERTADESSQVSRVPFMFGPMQNDKRNVTQGWLSTARDTIRDSDSARVNSSGAPKKRASRERITHTDRIDVLPI